MGHNETPIQKEILDWLNSIDGAKFTRTQSGIIRKGSRWIHFGEAGWFDITGAYRGFAVGFEVKPVGAVTEKKRKKKQKETAAKWIECGGRAFKVESLQDAKDAIRGLDWERGNA